MFIHHSLFKSTFPLSTLYYYAKARKGSAKFRKVVSMFFFSRFKIFEMPSTVFLGGLKFLKWRQCFFLGGLKFLKRRQWFF